MERRQSRCGSIGIAHVIHVAAAADTIAATDTIAAAATIAAADTIAAATSNNDDTCLGPEQAWCGKYYE